MIITDWNRRSGRALRNHFVRPQQFRVEENGSGVSRAIVQGSDRFEVRIKDSL